jgi:CopG family nickel-responsive transcriptional regulator
MKMPAKLVRLSLSIEETLFKKLEKIVRLSGYQNRSEFVRDMIRDRLVETEWEKGDTPVLCAITIVYNHHKRELSEKLTELQHRHHEIVLAATHVHLDSEICAEMIMAKGNPGNVNKLYDLLKKQKGVLHSGITMTSTAKKLF